MNEHIATWGLTKIGLGFRASIKGLLPLLESLHYAMLGAIVTPQCLNPLHEENRNWG